MLKRIECWNFQQFKHLDLNLKKRGLVWVVGQNEDTAAADSNGAGKSTITRAITWILYGKVIDKASRKDEIGDKVIRYGEKECIGQIDLDNGWRIKRSRKKGKPSLWLMAADGSEWTESDVQDRIIEMLGLDFHGFKNTCLFGQNDSSRFASPEIGDAQRKEMLHKLLRTERLSECALIAKDRLSIEKGVVSNYEHQIQNLSDKIASINITGIKAKMDKWEEQRAIRLSTLRDEILELKEKACVTADKAGDVKTCRATLEEQMIRLPELRKGSEGEAEARAAASLLERAHYAATSEVGSIKSHINNLEAQFKSLEGDQCEVCSSDLKSGKAKAKIDSIKVSIAEQKANLVNALAKRNKLVDEHLKSRKIVEDIEGHKRVLRNVEIQISQIEKEVWKCDSAIAESKAIIEIARVKKADRDTIKAQENPYENDYIEANAQIGFLNTEIINFESALEMANLRKSYLNFWVQGFGQQGLQSFVLDEPMPYLTERANHYLETLSDGDITVEFKTQRATKTTGLKDEIEISWVIENTPGQTPSGGQQRKIEIATDFAFMDLAETRESVGYNKMDLFIADEILSGLDPIGCERALDLLIELKKRRGTIIVIDPTGTTSELFERQWLITKKSGISTIEES